jgi:hypothetical protein
MAGEAQEKMETPESQKAYCSALSSMSVIPLAERAGHDIIDGLGFLKELDRIGIVREDDMIWRVSIVAEVGEPLNLVVERRVDAKTAVGLSTTIQQGETHG